jgi:hypothetical protein
VKANEQVPDTISCHFRSLTSHSPSHTSISAFRKPLHFRKLTTPTLSIRLVSANRTKRNHFPNDFLIADSIHFRSHVAHQSLSLFVCLNALALHRFNANQYKPISDRIPAFQVFTLVSSQNDAFHDIVIRTKRGTDIVTKTAD